MQEGKYYLHHYIHNIGIKLCNNDIKYQIFHIQLVLIFHFCNVKHSLPSFHDEIHSQLLLKQNPKKYPQCVQWKYVAHYSRYGQRLRETDALKGDFHTTSKIPCHQEHNDLGFVRKKRRRPLHILQTNSKNWYMSQLPQAAQNILPWKEIRFIY